MNSAFTSMRRALPTLLVVPLLLAGCTPAPQPAPVKTESVAATAPSKAAEVATVPGYAPGQFPSVPSIVIPDVSPFNKKVSQASVSLAEEIAKIPGLSVAPAHCNANGEPLVAGNVVVEADGSSVTNLPGRTTVSDGKGAGVHTDGEVSMVVDGQGGGTFTSPEASIVVETDGSGVYTSGTTSITIDGKGGGTWTDKSRGISVSIPGDGSGVSSEKDVNIVIEADGSGNYTAPGISIINDGKGKALVNGVSVDADPLPKVARVGKFPRIDSLIPSEPVCGLYVTLASEVLFDYNKDVVRPDGQKVLTSLVAPLNKLPAGTNLRLEGHTDSHGSADYNQGLSERRAKAVQDFLKDKGTTAPMNSVGFGKTRPVAPNEVGGKDNPSGRQLNRRVAIFIPMK